MKSRQNLTLIVPMAICAFFASEANAQTLLKEFLGETSANKECCKHAIQLNDSIEETVSLQNIVPSEVVTEEYAGFPINMSTPLVYNGFRRLYPIRIQLPGYIFKMKSSSGYDKDRYAGILYHEPTHVDDLEEGDEFLSVSDRDTLVTTSRTLMPEMDENDETVRWEAYIEPWTYSTPEWLQVADRRANMSEDLKYIYMIGHPEDIEYLGWLLPVPPKLKDDTMSFSEFVLSQFLPPVDSSEAVLPENEIKKVHWLHTVGGGLQFSQAYISRNWYQGGNDYLALLFNFNWDVALNTVYHPNLMFTSSLAYKLAINSNQKESLHRYSISQDLFQYNLKAGVKAFNKWFYSYTLQFKTELFNSYPSDSPNLTAAFLSPADLNMGLGMTYNTEGFEGRLKFSASIAPISYNLKACASNRIDVTQFNIAPGRHTRSEIGSNAELNLNWDITSNINWKSRMFIFSDYHYFQADWENTFTFNINRFLSTQLYVHPRYDSSSTFGGSKWHYWQLKEILSFGLSYTFSTKP